MNHSGRLRVIKAYQNYFAMQIHDVKINDATVTHEDSTPRVSFNVDISISCEGDLEAFHTAGQLDTTSLKDAAYKFLQEKLAQAAT